MNNKKFWHYDIYVLWCRDIYWSSPPVLFKNSCASDVNTTLYLVVSPVTSCLLLGFEYKLDRWSILTYCTFESKKMIQSERVLHVHFSQDWPHLFLPVHVDMTFKCFTVLESQSEWKACQLVAAICRYSAHWLNLAAWIPFSWVLLQQSHGELDIVDSILYRFRLKFHLKMAEC